MSSSALKMSFAACRQGAVIYFCSHTCTTCSPHNVLSTYSPLLKTTAFLSAICIRDCTNSGKLDELMNSHAQHFLRSLQPEQERLKDERGRRGGLALGPQNVKTPRAACTGTKPQLLARYMGCLLMAFTSPHSSRVPFVHFRHHPSRPCCCPAVPTPLPSASAVNPLGDGTLCLHTSTGAQPGLPMSGQ